MMRAMKQIHWKRVIVAAILSEVGVIAVLTATIGLYALFTTVVDYQALGEEVGYYVAPIAGVVTTALAVFWAARPLSSDFIRHGMLVGLVSVLLTLGFILTARPEHRLMYLIAFALRIVGGYLGGILARRRVESGFSRIAT